MNRSYRFHANQLLPEQWSSKLRQMDELRIYNPAIVRFRDRLLMAYRVDSGRRKSM